MVELVPVAEAAQRFLVLLLKGMCVYVVECLKRTAGQGGMSPYVSFKKAPNSLE